MKRTKSKQPRKQRKFLYNADIHLRRKLMSAHFSEELRKKYGRRSFPVRKGDEVEIMRGEFKGKRGKIVKVDLQKYKVYVDSVKRRKVDGSEVLVPIHPSNLKIISLNLDDDRRVKALERKVSKVAPQKAVNA